MQVKTCTVKVGRQKSADYLYVTPKNCRPTKSADRCGWEVVANFTWVVLRMFYHNTDNDKIDNR